MVLANLSRQSSILKIQRKVRMIHLSTYEINSQLVCKYYKNYTDDSTSLGAQQGASKRPVILPVEDKQKCFFTFYRIYEDQRRRLRYKLKD